MSAKIDPNAEKRIVQLPKSLRDLKIRLESEESVKGLIQEIALEAVEKKGRLLWSEREPLCARVLVQTLIVDRKFLSSIAPFFSVCLNDPNLTKALSEAISCSGVDEKSESVLPGLEGHIRLIAEHPEIFFNLCKDVLASGNYRLLFELTQYCADNPEFSEKSRDKFFGFISDILTKGDINAFTDLMDKGLLRFHSISTFYVKKTDVTSFLGKGKEMFIRLYLERGLVRGQTISSYSIERSTGSKYDTDNNYWDQIELLIANGAIVEPPGRGLSSYHNSEEERMGYPLKEKAYAFFQFRQKLYAEEFFKDGSYLNSSDQQFLWTWIANDREAAVVLKKHPDFFKKCLKKLPSENLNFSPVLQQYLAAGCFDPVADGIPLLFEAIEENSVRLVEALVQAGVSLNSVQKKSTPFEHALRVYNSNAFRMGTGTLNFLIENPATDCNQVFSSGWHPVEVLFQSSSRASPSDKEALLKKMLDKGVDLSSCKKLSLMQMVESIKPDHIPFLKLLVSHGISLDERNRDQESVFHLLMYAYQNGSTGRGDILSLLDLMIRRDPTQFASVIDRNGKTPLDLAISWKISEVVLLVAQLGALPEDFSEKVDDSIDPTVKLILNTYAKTEVPSSAKELEPWLTLQNMGNLFGDAILKNQRSAQGGQLEGQSIGDSLKFLLALLSASQGHVIANGADEEQLAKIEEARGRLNRLIPLSKTVDWCSVDENALAEKFKEDTAEFMKGLAESRKRLEGLGDLKKARELLDILGKSEEESDLSKNLDKPPTILDEILDRFGGDLDKFYQAETDKFKHKQQELRKVLIDGSFKRKHLPILCGAVSSQIEALRPGEVLLLPSGWGNQLKDGHAMLVEVKKNGNGTFSLKVINTGAGIDAHARRHTPLKELVNAVRAFDGISQKQLLGTGFIEALLAPKTYFPKDGANRYTEKDIYHLLFSRFEKNAAPLSEESKGCFVTAQRSGTCPMRASLACLHNLLGTSLYKHVKIGIDHTLFEAISLSNVIEKYALDPTFIRLLEHSIRRSSLNLYKNQEIASIDEVEKAAALIQEVSDSYPKRVQQAGSSSGSVVAEIDPQQDYLQKAVALIDDARSQVINFEEDSALLPCSVLDLPLIDFSTLSSGEEWIGALDQLIHFFDESAQIPLDMKRVVPAHLTTRSIATLPLPHQGVFHPQIDADHFIGTLSLEQKKLLAEKLKSLSERYATAFYEQRKRADILDLSNGNPEAVEEYIAVNKMYALYWRLSLHLEEGAEGPSSLTHYGIDVSHLKAVQKSIYLPSYSPHIYNQLDQLIQFFEASHPEKGNRKRTLLEVGAWELF